MWLLMINQISINDVHKSKKTVLLDGSFNVIFKMSDNNFFEGEFICETVSYSFCYPSSHLTLQLGEKTFQKSARDYFEALCKMREDLEQQQIYPCCYGACKNVYPIGLVRGMGNGLKAYNLEFGEQAKKLVNIFAGNKDIEPVTVAEQKKFYEDYCNSFSW